MIIRVDIDGVLCTNTNGAYHDAKPFPENIAKINAMYEAGHKIILWTARGTTTGTNWRQLTELQVAAWGVKYHELHFGKPEYDLFIDDKARSVP